MNIEIKDIRDLKEKVGALKTKRILEIVGNEAHLVDALNTDIGREIAKDALDQLDAIQAKIINETATEADRAEFRVLRRILRNWLVKVDGYYKALSQIRRG